jgi:hypothetical protein
MAGPRATSKPANEEHLGAKVRLPRTKKQIPTFDKWTRDSAHPIGVEVRWQVAMDG